MPLDCLLVCDILFLGFWQWCIFARDFVKKETRFGKDFLMSPQNFTKSVLYCVISKFLIFSAMSMSLKIANEWSGDDGEEASL